jgi:hypothetical protein
MSTDNEKSSRFTGKGLLQATLSFVVYITLMFITYLIAYGNFLDDRFLWEVVLAIGFVGALPLSFQRRWFGFIFLAGGVIGFVVDCAVSAHALSLGRPNMEGGFLFIFIIAIAFIAGIVAEIFVNILRKKRINNEIIQ